MNKSEFKYRGDIDGLRALAIIPVILFHFFPHSLTGGYVGVDIFFVISGFLISSIIFRQTEEKKFSFVNFYLRRIRRIFPTLILVLLALISFGWFFMVTSEYKMLGHDTKFAAAFASNINSMLQAGYFDRASEVKPLLHLWSLAIEEQFYIVYPILVWATGLCSQP